MILTGDRGDWGGLDVVHVCMRHSQPFPTWRPAHTSWPAPLRATPTVGQASPATVWLWALSRRSPSYFAPGPCWPGPAVTAFVLNTRTATRRCNKASLTCPSHMPFGLIKKYTQCAYCTCNGYGIWMPGPLVAEINSHGAYGRCTRRHKRLQPRAGSTIPTFPQHRYCGADPNSRHCPLTVLGHNEGRMLACLRDHSRDQDQP